MAARPLETNASAIRASCKTDPASLAAAKSFGCGSSSSVALMAMASQRVLAWYRRNISASHQGRRVQEEAGEQEEKGTQTWLCFQFDLFGNPPEEPTRCSRAYVCVRYASAFVASQAVRQSGRQTDQAGSAVVGASEKSKQRGRRAPTRERPSSDDDPPRNTCRLAVCRVWPDPARPAGEARRGGEHNNGRETRQADRHER